MPESDMQPSPIADTAMPEEPSTRVGSFSTLLIFCHLTEFLTPLALSYHIAAENVPSREPDQKRQVIVLNEDFMIAHRVEIISLAARYRLPAVYPFRFFAELADMLVALRNVPFWG
jgi:hypothetical protein